MLKDFILVSLGVLQNSYDDDDDDDDDDDNSRSNKINYNDNIRVDLLIKKNNLDKEYPAPSLTHFYRCKRGANPAIAVSCCSSISILTIYSYINLLFHELEVNIF